MAINRSEQGHYDELYARIRSNQDLLTETIKGEGYKANTRVGTLPAFMGHLADARGKRILDIGCGTGWLMTNLVQQEAMAVGVDISSQGLHLAQDRGRANLNNQLNLALSTGLRLPFADKTFDMVVGFAVLHHLTGDLETMAQEITRVIKPNGRAVFCEPLGENPILEWVRKHVSYINKDPHTRNEKPFGFKDVEIFLSPFKGSKVEYVSFTQMLDRLIPNQKLSQVLRGIDIKLLKLLPALNRFCRYVVLDGEN